MSARSTSAFGIRRLAFAQAISFAGGTSSFVALSSFIYATTGSAVWVAAVAAVSFGLPALISPLAGALGDRYDRRWVMICSDLSGVLCFLALGLLSAPLALVVVKAVAAIAAAPFFPASAAAIPRLVGTDELPRANATVSTWGTAGALVGPLAGGIATALIGASDVFVINSVSFLISAVLIAGLRGNLRPDRHTAQGHQGMSAGLSFLAADPTLRRITIGFAFLFVGIGTTLPAEIVRAQDFGVGSGGYGLMIAVWAGGGMIGAQLAGRLLCRWSSLSLLSAGGAGLVASFSLAALAPWFGLLLVGLVAGGLAEGLGEVAHRFLVQRRAPDPLLSRVFAATSATEQIALSLPLLYAGVLVDGLGASIVYGIAAAFCVVGAVLLMRCGGLRA